MMRRTDIFGQKMKRTKMSAVDEIQFKPRCDHMSGAASKWSLTEAAGGMEGMFSAFLSTSPAEGKANEAKCRAALRWLPGRSRCESCCCDSHKHRVYLQCYLFFNYLATLQAPTLVNS